MERPLPYPPRSSAATKPFWDALRDERFVTTQCQACGDLTFPPKVICPRCLSDRLGWARLSGEGTLYSYTRVWSGPEIFANELPYTLCVVDLREGLRLGSRLLDDSGTPKVGDAVSLVFVHHLDGTLYYFELDD